MEALRARLGVRGKRLRTRLRRAGRRLPRHARRAGQVVLGAERMMDHPRLRLRIDAQEVSAAFADLHASLAAIDPRERRKDAALGIAGGIVLNLMLVGAAVVGVLVWRGLV
ncbi:hypothetical protein D6850_03190 [Roseovarius spongiae]|uniref:Uncharacterized protein n=2 Tax=Roseovarius spongiae TaxID=2320272 RepID=A0A3A8AYM7_9RHOB|nr:hypothetical protein D6850_03190 [Roseovarius spongiae]